jgi:hypothetical protein
MPRLSMYRPNKGNDYKFFDRRISEQFTVGGVDINIHKYLGPLEQGTSIVTSATQSATGAELVFANTSAIARGMFVAGIGIPAGATVIAKTSTTITLSASTTTIISSGTTVTIYTDATQPSYANESAKNIQDLLFLENRDRKYDTSIYTMRSIYRMNDNDFDLSQFGLFLTGDTMFMVFHLNDMIELVGRKIMVGDVMELPHLKDFYPLDDDLPSALKRYYVVQDATRAAEGFSPTWYPHLWRVKVAPLVDSQEYKDITTNISSGDEANTPIGDLLSTYNKYTAVNDAIIARAEIDVPLSGYDTSSIYVAPVNKNGYPGNPTGADASDVFNSSSIIRNASEATVTPSAKVQGYLTSDATPPNGKTVGAGISFPDSPLAGDYFLRLDYVPNRLFRYDSRRWIKIEDSVRTNLTPGLTNTSQASSFVNNINARYSGSLGWDAIKVSNPYTPPVDATTLSVNVSAKVIVTKIAYVSTYGVKTTLNGTHITNTMSNTAGNVSFTLTNTLASNDLLEYTIYSKVTPERQGLSDILSPLADN